MKTKINSLRYLTFIFALIWSVNLSLSVNGQKIGGDKAKDQDKTLQVLSNKSVLSPVETYNKAAAEYEAKPTQANRDKLVFMAISQIDLNFGQYIQGKRHRNSYFQIVIDVLEVAAATAISITNGERAKSIIADGLGFVQGSRSSINKNLRLLEQQILVNKMIEKRSIALAVIYDKINQPVDQYPFERAFIDILAYYQAGTTDSALSSLATDSGKSATDAETALAKAKIKRDAGIRLAPTKAQIATSMANREFVDKLVKNYDEAEAKVKKADENIESANKQIAAENLAPTPNAAVIADAVKKRTEAESEKKTAETDKQKSLDKLKVTFNAIEQDIVLAALLDELPEKIPNLADSIKSSLAKIRDKKGDVDDYYSILLKFFSLVTEAATENPTVVERAKMIVDLVNKEN
jgi:hypothetical protein